MEEEASKGLQGGTVVLGLVWFRNLALGQSEWGTEKQETGDETLVEAFPIDQLTDDWGWNEERWQEQRGERHKEAFGETNGPDPDNSVGRTEGRQRARM